MDSVTTPKVNHFSVIASVLLRFHCSNLQNNDMIFLELKSDVILFIHSCLFSTWNIREAS